MFRKLQHILDEKIEAGFNLEAHTQMIAFETKKERNIFTN